VQFRLHNVNICTQSVILVSYKSKRSLIFHIFQLKNGQFWRIIYISWAFVGNMNDVRCSIFHWNMIQYRMTDLSAESIRGNEKFKKKNDKLCIIYVCALINHVLELCKSLKTIETKIWFISYFSSLHIIYLL